MTQLRAAQLTRERLTELAAIQEDTLAALGCPQPTLPEMDIHLDLNDLDTVLQINRALAEQARNAAQEILGRLKG